MKIKRVTSQSGQTIAEFFTAVAEQNRDNGADLLVVNVQLDFAEIMSQLENCSDESEQVFASATESSLNVALLAKDDETSAPIANLAYDLSVTGSCLIEISYPMMESEAPWPNATVSGIAPNVREASRMIAIAVERSANSEPSG